MYFDARAAKLAKPGEHIIVVGCPGLRLEVSATRRAWTYRYSHPVTGLMKQIKIGLWPHMSIGEAAAEWEILRSRRDAGEELTRTKPTPAPEKAYALGDMVRDYHAGYLLKHRQAKGAHAVNARLVKATADHAAMPVDQITRRFCYDLIDGLSDRPVLANSVKTELSAAHRHAMDAGRISEDLPDWWALVMARKLRSKGALRDGEHKGATKRVLSEPEISTLLTQDLTLFSQQVQDFLTLQLWTCARGGEIVQMHDQQITVKDGVMWWTLPKALTKGMHRAGATDLRTPIVGRARAIVERLQGNGWLFPSVSRTGKVQHQEQAYMNSKVHYLQPYSKSRPDHVRKRMTVTHWSVHDLRRTGRTMLAMMGCPSDVGEAILGHVKPGIVGTYDLYAQDAEKLEWLRRLGERLEALAG